MNPAAPAFKLERQTIFLTYPHCDKTKEELLAFFQGLGPLSEYIVASELHADGQPHIHAFLKYSTKIRTRSMRFFDYLGHHPNIRTPNKKEGIAAVKAYVAKDGDFLTNIDGLVSRKEQMAIDLLNSGLTREFIRQHPSIIFTNYQSIRSWLNFFNATVMAPVQNLPKRRHYWVYGPPNSGKTRGFLNFLVQLYASAEIPDNNDWTNTDQTTTLLYKDEYKGCLTIQKLNQICDGRTILNTKGGSTGIAYPLVVICSNFNIRNCYINASDVELDALSTRFHQIDAGVRLPKWSSVARCLLD